MESNLLTARSSEVSWEHRSSCPTSAAQAAANAGAYKLSNSSLLEAPDLLLLLPALSSPAP